MFSLKIVSFLCLIAFCLACKSHKRATGESSWSKDLQEELKIWREQNTGKAEPRGHFSSASKALENFLFDEGVPSDSGPFSAATPEQVEKAVVLHLYTKGKDHIITGPISSLERQGFHKNVDTTFLIHGYGDDTSGAVVQLNKDRKLETATTPVNVIGVDWSKLCPKPHYVWSIGNAKPTGEFLGKWIAELVRNGLLRPTDVHLIGHSLGAHVAGRADASAKDILSTPVSQVTGLDPANPLFARSTPDSGKISPSDAALVDVIHTAGGHERVCFLYGDSSPEAKRLTDTLCDKYVPVGKSSFVSS